MLWRVRNVHDEFLNLSLYHLSKRASELDQFGDNMALGDRKWTEPNIWEIHKWYRFKSWNIALLRYKNEMLQLIKWVNKTNSSKAMLYVDKVKINEQINQHRVTLIDRVRKGNKTEKEKAALLVYVNNTFDSLSDKLALRPYDSSSLTYKVNKPTWLKGDYELIVQDKENSLDELVNSQILIDNNVLTPVSKNVSNNMVSFGFIDLSSTELRDIVLKLPLYNLVNNSDWDALGNVKTANNVTDLDMLNVTIDGSGGLVKEIPQWRAEQQYVVTFEYLTFGTDFRFRIFDNKSRKGTGIPVQGELFLEKILNSSDWKKTQSVVSSGKFSENGFLQVLSSNSRKNTHIQIRNLSVVKVRNPKIALRKIVKTQTNELKDLPKITFTKINPTKYVISVAEAYKPYTIVFQEAFNSNWRLYDSSNEVYDFQNTIERVIANMGKAIVNLFIKEDDFIYTITDSYFNGKIQEGQHGNRFVTRSLFDSWGKSTVAQHKHVRANGYANAWIIRPEEMNSRTSYTLILEMRTQRLFYIFVAVSFFSFLVLLVYYVFLLLQNEKDK